jgi:hypothetical protein
MKAMEDRTLSMVVCEKDLNLAFRLGISSCSCSIGDAMRVLSVIANKPSTAPLQPRLK